MGRYDIVVAVHHHRFGALQHVAIVVLWAYIVERAPCAEVGPADAVNTEHRHIVGLFKHGVVDGNALACGVNLFDELLFLVGAVDAFALTELRRHLGGVVVECLDNGSGTPEEDAGVPVKLATIHKHLRQLQVGLFGECFHHGEIAVDFTPLLNVAVAGFGVGGFHAKGEQRVVVLDKLERLFHTLAKFVDTQNDIVARSHHDFCVGVECLDMVGCPGVAWSGASVCWLAQYLAVGDFGHLLLHQVHIFAASEHDNIFLWNNTFQSRYGEL